MVELVAASGAIQRRRHQVQIAVVVVIEKSGSYCLPPQSEAVAPGGIGEGTVAPVVVKLVGVALVRDKQVQIAVVVVVAKYGRGFAAGKFKAGLVAGFGKALAVVAVKPRAAGVVGDKDIRGAVAVVIPDG